MPYYNKTIMKLENIKTRVREFRERTQIFLFAKINIISGQEKNHYTTQISSDVIFILKEILSNILNINKRYSFHSLNSLIKKQGGKDRLSNKHII